MDSGGGAATGAGLPASAEEEAHKRNTDCVYFLASPLTCKKGSECEYRHSEGARVNPRDCWYWLNGECLNPKCSFRHPPFDPLFGVPEANKKGSAQPPFASFPVAYGTSAYNMNKQNVPCYYFQKGHCLKGDKCSFMHGSSTIGNINPQHVPAICSPLSDPTYTKNNEKLVKECTSQQGCLKESVNEREMSSLSAKPVVIESEPNNGSVIVHNASPYPSQYDYPSFESNSLQHSWPESIQAPSEDEHLQASREVDELLGESSPGFDVLVDDHEEDPDYYQNEEEYGQASVQDGRNLKPLDDFDHQHYDYEHISGFERDSFTEGRGDRYRRSHDPYDREKLRISSERRREKSSTPEKRKYDTDFVDESDLRHQLKQRRLNSRRLAISPDRHPSRSRVTQRLHEQRSQVGHSSREYRSVQEGFVGSCLHGRISLPVRSQIERNPERNWNRSSIGRPVNYQGRQHERIKSRQTDMNYSLRKYDGQTNRRVEADVLDFAGPKSLAELKCAKVSEDSQNQKGLVSRVYQDSENSLSFEGPKPLSLILKKIKDTAFGNGSCNIYGSNHKESEGQVALRFDGHLQHAFEATQAGNTIIVPEAPKIAGADGEEEEGMIQEENGELLDGEEFSEKGDISEDGGVILDSVDYNETDSYGQGEGEFDYGETDGGEFKPEDDEVYQEDVEEYDEDDFAKKAGFMLS